MQQPFIITATTYPQREKPQFPKVHNFFNSDIHSNIEKTNQ